jgi:hypothetical protein
MKVIRFDIDEGRSYEDVYSGWLVIFKEVAESKIPVKVENAPHVWLPLIEYLGGAAQTTVQFGPDEWWTGHNITQAARVAKANGEFRSFVEHVCSCRPELVDALWRADRVWNTYSEFHAQHEPDFVVASVNSFDRPEIKAYENALSVYDPREDGRKNCVITNCAADKPYPAPLHEAIQELLPDGTWHMVTATGVLGLIPQELWSCAPHYDSGWPNFERLRAVATDYFSRVRYERVVVYTDLYAPVVAEVLTALRVPASFPLDLRWRTGYLPLTSPVLLDRLRDALSEPVKEITP